MLRLGYTLRLSLLAVMLGVIGLDAGHAEGLRVSPVLLEVTAPGAATTLTLRNDGRLPITVQSRIFRWEQKDGQDQLSRTRDVVVSPPMTRLAPGAQQTIRVVRTSRSAVQGEEAYRLYVDEVPDQARARSGTVAFATRMRVPVFFVEPGVLLPDVHWVLRTSGRNAVLEGRNTGQVRLRMADLRLTQGGKMVSRHDGLLGYVLGGATMRWPVAAASSIGSGRVKLQASTSRGALDANVSTQ